MSSDFSSFDKDKKIFDGWRQFLKESARTTSDIISESPPDRPPKEEPACGTTDERGILQPACPDEDVPVGGSHRHKKKKKKQHESAAPGMVVLDEDENLEEREIGGGSAQRMQDLGLKTTTIAGKAANPPSTASSAAKGKDYSRFKREEIPAVVVKGKPEQTWMDRAMRAASSLGGSNVATGNPDGSPVGSEIRPADVGLEESLARIVTQELEKILNEKNTIPNPEYTGGPRPEYENTVGSPVIYQPPQARPGPAGIEIDPVAKAHMDQRPEFDDLGVEDEVVDGRSTGRQLYRTADLETFKIGTDMDFLSNRTPLPSIRMAHQKGLIDPRTNRLTDLGKGVVSGWKEKHGNQAMRENLNFDYIVQEVYKRLNKPKGK